MADDITLGPKSGRAVVAADDISGVLHRRVKVQHGADGSATDVSTASPMPVTATLNSSVIGDAQTALTPKFALIAIAATGTLVAAVVGKKIRVLAVAMTIEVVTGDETYTFKSAAAGTALTGAIGDTAMTVLVTVPPIPFVLPFSPVGWFETISGELLELSLAGTTPNAKGCLVYVEV